MNSAKDLLDFNKNFAIEYVKREDVSSMSSNHYHNHYEIYYQLSGERYYFIKDRAYYVKKGDIVLINKYELHKTTYAGANTYERILIDFKEDFLAPFTASIKDIEILACFNRDIPVISSSINDTGFIEGLFNKMLNENKKEAPGYNTYLSICLIELLIFINRLKDKPQNNYLEYPSALHKKISEIAKYINNNYTQDLSLKIIAEQFYVSQFYLSRTFKAVTGFTFTEYLNNIRIKEAQKFLKNTNLSITEIASIVGFESATHFGRVFKLVTMLSPLKYRKSVFKY